MATVGILILAGVLLLALETVLPGLIAGAAGLACLAAAVFFAYRDLGVVGGNLALVGIAAFIVAGGAAWLRYLPRSRLGRRFASERIISDTGAAQPELLHQTGTAVSNLRPSGIALIGGRRVDVVTEGAMVSAGSPVRVVEIEGIRVVVRVVEVAPNETTSGGTSIAMTRTARTRTPTTPSTIKRKPIHATLTSATPPPTSVPLSSHDEPRHHRTPRRLRHRRTDPPHRPPQLRSHLGPRLVVRRPRRLHGVDLPETAEGARRHGRRQPHQRREIRTHRQRGRPPRSRGFHR